MRSSSDTTSAGGPGGNDWFGTGTALHELLTAMHEDVAAWSAALDGLNVPDPLGHPKAAAALAGSPFEPWPCGDNLGGPHGLVTYRYDGTALSLLVQGSPDSFLTLPSITGYGIDESGTVHLFWWAGFRS